MYTYETCVSVFSIPTSAWVHKRVNARSLRNYNSIKNAQWLHPLKNVVFRRAGVVMKWFFESGKYMLSAVCRLSRQKRHRTPGLRNTMPPNFYRKIGSKVVEIKNMNFWQNWELLKPLAVAKYREEKISKKLTKICYVHFLCWFFWRPIRFGPRQHDSEVRNGFLSLGGGKEKK